MFEDASFYAWGFSLVLAIGLLLSGLLSYLVLSELEDDYLNPVHGCQRLRPLLLLESGVSAALFFVQFFEADWIAVASSSVLFAYQIYAFAYGIYNLDSTKIFQEIQYRKTHQQGKIAAYLIIFTLFIYKFLRLFAKGLFKYFSRNIRGFKML